MVRDPTLGNHQNHDVRDHLSERLRHDNHRYATRSYHPRHGDCYDSEEDRSPSPEPLGSYVSWGGTNDYKLIIRNMPLFLSDVARA